MDADAILNRIDRLLKLEVHEARSGAHSAGGDIGEMYQGALQLLRLAHGGQTPQETVLVRAFDSLEHRDGSSLQYLLQPVILGTLRSLKAEVVAGLLGSVERRGAGEALADFGVLAKESLAQNNENGKNIAAVLVAALFEDTVRRLAATRAGIHTREKLQHVLIALKSSGILQGATFTIANSFLKFRNDALHADWNDITRPAVESCLGFVESLLREHFT